MSKKTVFLIIILAEIACLSLNVGCILSAGRMNVRYTAADLLVYKGAGAEDEGFNAVSSSGCDAVLVTTPELTLNAKGIYGVTVYYESDSEALYTSVSCDLDDRLIGVDEYRLDHSGGSFSYDIYTKEAGLPVKIRMYMDAEEEDRRLDVQAVDVFLKRGRTVSCCLVVFGVPFAIFDLLLFFIFFKKETLKDFLQRHGAVIVTALFTAMIAAIPMMLDYIPDADDLDFSIMRIQGIADGISCGYFPVKIHPTWYNGFGYAVGVYYGQVLLYPFAILRYLGLPVGTVYRLFIVSLNLLTFYIAYFSVNKLTKKTDVAVCTAVYYTMSLYRLIDIHKRSAVGEVSAMAFLPLAILGIALIYGLSSDRDDKGWIYLALGVTGVINSHNLTIVMLLVMCALFAIFNLKVTLKKTTLKKLAKCALLTAVLNAFYLVPFLDYMLSISTKLNSSAKDMAAKAAYVTQVFSQAYSVTGYNGEHTPIGDMPLSIGVSALFILAAVIILIMGHGYGERKRALLNVIVLFIISVILATTIFPYEAVSRRLPALYEVMRKLQYPWRYLVFSTLFITFIFAVSMVMVEQHYGKQVMMIYTVVILLLTVIQGKGMLDQIVHEKSGPTFYSANDLYWAASEYLPSNTEPEQLYDTRLVISGDGVYASLAGRNGINFSLDVSNQTQDVGYVQVPLLCYPYYRAKDESGRQLEVIAGDYHKLCFAVPQGYEGRVDVYFREPLYWRLAELISLAGVIVLILRCRSAKPYNT